jgi:hypothetical protein
MKNLFYIFILLTLFSCDYQGSYTFKAKNETSKNIEFRFYYESSQYSSSEEYVDRADEITSPRRSKLTTSRR